MLEYYLLGIILLPGIIFAIWAQTKVTNSYHKWSEILSVGGLTGKEVARFVLDDNGLNDVRITSVSGTMTDYYDPRKKIIALSDGVANSSSIAAIGIAMHEVGHAIQYKHNYLPIKLRNIIIPLSNFVSRMMWPLVITGLVFSFLLFPGSTFGLAILYISVISFSLAVLLNLVTLPVEFNASRRAISILEAKGYLMQDELEGAKKVLGAAALTYVAALVVAILNLLRFVLAFLVRNND